MDMEISPEQFGSMDRDEQMIILYETLQVRGEKCDKKFEKLRNGKRTDKGIAAMFGLVGGFVASLFK